jgi:hypothetical protein
MPHCPTTPSIREAQNLREKQKLYRITVNRDNTAALISIVAKIKKFDHHLILRKKYNIAFSSYSN